MVDIKELEEALSPKKKGGKKTAARKKVKSSPKNASIIYQDKKGNKVEPKDLEIGREYYVMRGDEKSK